MDMAPYIADARALELVLLGGYTGAEVEGHDWEYLLGATGLLEYDRCSVVRRTRSAALSFSLRSPGRNRLVVSGSTASRRDTG